MSAGLGGFRPWLLQRITAVVVGVGTVALILLVLFGDWTYEHWRAFVGTPLVAIAFMLFFGALLLHAWIGVRDVIIDYVHPLAYRLATLTLVGLVLTGCAAWAAAILLSRVMP
ncbi:MAG: succinate dehydrogenase, hydrophobic membrane anchor protein [Thiotrichales bacterium]